MSEISWDRIQHPNEVLEVGQEVEVKVISLDRERKRIGLSIRQLQRDPWLDKVEKFKEGVLVEGEVTHLTKFGAFARIDEDLEGLIHVSELSEQRIAHPKEVVKEGDVLTLRVIKIDAERRRIGLSLRKVDSAAYADFDWKMALAEEVGKTGAEEGAEEPALEEPTPAEQVPEVETIEAEAEVETETEVEIQADDSVEAESSEDETSEPEAETPEEEPAEETAEPETDETDVEAVGADEEAEEDVEAEESEA